LQVAFFDSVHTEAQNQLKILFVYVVADDNINYLCKFIVLYSKEDWISIHNLHALKGYGAKK